MFVAAQMTIHERGSLLGSNFTRFVKHISNRWHRLKALGSNAVLAG
jgi:hypothetical protein